MESGVIAPSFNFSTLILNSFGWSERCYTPLKNPSKIPASPNQAREEKNRHFIERHKMENWWRKPRSEKLIQFFPDKILEENPRKTCQENMSMRYWVKRETRKQFVLWTTLIKTFWRTKHISGHLGCFSKYKLSYQEIWVENRLCLKLGRSFFFWENCFHHNPFLFWIDVTLNLFIFCWKPFSAHTHSKIRTQKI